MGFDGKKFGEEIVAAVKAHVEKKLAPILDRLDVLTKRVDDMPCAADEIAIADRVSEHVLANMPVAQDGVGLAGAFIDRDGELVVTLTNGQHQKLGPVVGRDADNREIKQALCAELGDTIEALKAEVEQARKSIPTFELPDIDAKIAEAVRAIDGLHDAKALSVEDLLPLIDKRVSEAFAERPQPQDGKSVTVEDVRPIIKSEVASAVEQIPKPRDGRDGRDGKDGKDADMPALERMITDGCKAIQEKVRDGKDGLGFDDMDVETTDEGVFLVFRRGDDEKRFHLPLTTDRGVYKHGVEYRKGSGCTWGGSYWIAQKDTSDKPGEGDAWRLAVKRGRDGKDSK